MQSFLERYLAGEHEVVWTELIELGAGARLEPVFTDALAVARETMRRAYHNAELIHSRLQEFGYPFAEPDTALLPARRNAKKRITEIERIAGPMALSVRAWYETFDTIDFSNNEHFFNPDSEFALLMDTFYVKSLATGWKAYVESVREGSADGHKEWLSNHPDERPIVFLHVAGSESNCTARGFELPNLGADQWFYGGGYGGQFFVQHLRERFRWGGFPVFGELFDEEELQAEPGVIRWELWKNWYYSFREGLLAL